MNAPHVRRVARTLHELDEITREKAYLAMDADERDLLLLHAVADIGEQLAHLRTEFEAHAKRPRSRTKRAAAAAGGLVAALIGGAAAMWKQ